MASASFSTLSFPVSDEVEIRRSRFLTFLEPVSDEAGARDLFARIRGRFPDARHHCTAFVLGPDRRLQRSNDDGEPSGTAGRPMLESLLQAQTVSPDSPVRDLSDVAAVVVRYFGGVLLGAGGLTRAYSSCVSDAVAKAAGLGAIVRVDRMLTFSLPLPHAEAGRVEAEVRRAGFSVLGVDYLERAILQVGAAPESVGALEALVALLTQGSAELEATGERWAPRP